MFASQAQGDGSLATASERKSYRRGGAFIKRCLRPNDFHPGYRGLHNPRLRKGSLMNEAESLRYIRHNTDIPVPEVHCDFEDEDAYYLIMEYVEGVSMLELSDDQKTVVCEELESHIAKLKTLKSSRVGGPSGIVIPPHRVMRSAETDSWYLRPSDYAEYVFCHNDLTQENIIVDPDTLRIKAIVDWAHAGFYPARFEYPFYNRMGPSFSINGETDDTPELLEFLEQISVVKQGCSVSQLTGVIESMSIKGWGE